MEEALVVSLFDRTGNWPRPWAEDRASNHAVLTVDQAGVPEGFGYPGRIHVEVDLSNPLTYDTIMRLVSQAGWEARRRVLLIAVPCTDFAASGARYFKEKDADGRTQASVALVRAALRFKSQFIRPGTSDIWVLENPVGRIAKLVPELGPYSLIFNPCDYGGYLNPPGDDYTKRTCLWGNFTRPPFKPVNPTKGSMILKWGVSSDRTKFERSKTPLGFARAFYAVNR